MRKPRGPGKVNVEWKKAFFSKGDCSLEKFGPVTVEWLLICV